MDGRQRPLEDPSMIAHLRAFPASCSFGSHVLVAALLLAAPAVASPPRFAAPFIAYPMAFGSQTVITGDVNGDAHPDVLTTGSAGLQVRLGLGDGTLGPAEGYPGGAGPFLVAGDLDHDGHADLVMGGDSVSVAVQLGLGDGSFGLAVKFAVTKAPVAAVLADFDGDGNLDLATLSTRAGTVTVRLGLGDGTFAPGTDLAVGAWAVGLAAGLLDGDGHPDLVVVQSLPAQLSPWLGNGAGGFTSGTPIALPSAWGPVVLADLDGDAHLDAVIPAAFNVSQAYVLRGRADGSFDPPGTLALPGRCTSVAISMATTSPTWSSPRTIATAP
jgi:hypothetical protein